MYLLLERACPLGIAVDFTVVVVIRRERLTGCPLQNLPSKQCRSPKRNFHFEQWSGWQWMSGFTSKTSAVSSLRVFVRPRDTLSVVFFCGGSRTYDRHKESIKI